MSYMITFRSRQRRGTMKAKKGNKMLIGKQKDSKEIISFFSLPLCSTVKNIPLFSGLPGISCKLRDNTNTNKNCHKESISTSRRLVLCSLHRISQSLFSSRTLRFEYRLLYTVDQSNCSESMDA